MRRFFIIGNPRSGTTLLRLMLNMHSDVCVPPEAGFLVWLHSGHGDFTYTPEQIEAFLSDLGATRKIEFWRLDYARLRKHIHNARPRTYAELNDAVYDFYCRVVLNRRVTWIGDKNNSYVQSVDLLRRLYPSARFVHIVRDGRSVAASYIGLSKRRFDSRYAPDLPSTINDIAAEWVANLSNVRRALSQHDADLGLTIRFEDLASTPENTLRRVCSFLSLEFQPGMLEYYDATEAQGGEPGEFDQWKHKNKLPVQTDEARRYEDLSPEERRLFERLAGDELRRFGYLVNEV